MWIAGLETACSTLELRSFEAAQLRSFLSNSKLETETRNAVDVSLQFAERRHMKAQDEILGAHPKRPSPGGATPTLECALGVLS